VVKKSLSKAGPPGLLAIISGCTHRPVGGPMGGWDHMMGFGGYGGIFMWLIIIIVVAVILYLVLNRNLSPGSPRAGTRESPLEVLKRRYAEGEITKEEFDRMKREIEE
jgi:putative membrane protein